MSRIFAAAFLVVLFGSSDAHAQAQGIVDLHVHALNPANIIAAFGVNPESSEWGQVCTTREHLLEETVKQLRAANVRTALIHGSNEMVKEWKKAHPDLFVASFHPNIWDPAFLTLDQEAEAEKFGKLVDEGVYCAMGELLHVYEGVPLDIPILFPYYKVAEEKGIPVLFHTGDPFGGNDPLAANMSDKASPARIPQIAERFPKLQIVACHGGMGQWELLVKVMEAYPNVGADISNANWVADNPQLAKGIETLRAKKMMHRVYFGSDQCVFPDLIPRTVENTRRVLRDEEQSAVFHDNAARLLRLPNAGPALSGTK